MLYYHISGIAIVNAVICDGGGDVDGDNDDDGGDHQNDGYDNYALYQPAIMRLLGASPASVKHNH